MDKNLFFWRKYMDPKGKQSIPENNPEVKGWKSELTGEARGKVTSKSQLKDIHKIKNMNYFARVKNFIANSKVLGEKLRAAISRIKQQTKEAEKKIKDFYKAQQNGKAFHAMVVAKGYAKSLVKGLGVRVQRTATDISNLKSVLAGGMVKSYEVLVGVRYKEPPKHELKNEVNEKGKDSQKKESKKSASEPDQQENPKQSDKSPEVSVAANSQKTGKSKSENEKLKEVARGATAVSAIGEEQKQKSAIRADKAEKSSTVGLSKTAEKQMRKEERRQEESYRKLEAEKDKGITAARTVSDRERTEAEKSKAEKMPERQNYAAEAKRKADELRQAVLTNKIIHLREKLDKLQAKREENAKASGPQTKENTVKMTAKEAEALPSVKAEKAMQQAEMSLEVSQVEKSGAVTEDSLKRMEESAEKAEAGLKQTTLVPDYATPEFKQKAEEQGIPLNKSDKEPSKTDKQKMYALSGRTVSEAENKNREDENQNQGNESMQNQETEQRDKSQLRIDPEKSKDMSAEKGKGGKTIDMAAYNYMHGGRSTG